MKHDARGIPVSTGSAEAIALYESAIVQLHSYVGDPIATIDRAPRRVARVRRRPRVQGARAGDVLRAPVRARDRRRRRAGAAATARRPTRASAASSAAAQHLSNGAWNDACVALDAVLVDIRATRSRCRSRT
jgi:hypothetical protein